MKGSAQPVPQKEHNLPSPPLIRRPALLIAVLFVAHLFFVDQYPGFINPNILSRIYTTLAIIDDGTLAIDGPLQRYADTQDKALYAGRHYSDKPPGYSIALVPLAWIVRKTLVPEENIRAMLVVLRVLGLALPIVLLWEASVAYFEGLTRRRSLALAVVLCGALGTPFFIYATRFFAASAAGALLFASYLLLVRVGVPSHGTRRASTTALQAGLLAGAAFTFDFIVMPAVAVLAVHAGTVAEQRWRRVSSFGAGVVAMLLAWMAHNWLCFNHPLSVGFHFHADPRYAALYEQGFWGIQLPSLDAIVGLTISPMRGLFFVSPVLLLAFWGYGLLWREPRLRGEAMAAAAVFASILVFATTTVEWQGGWSMGARYLVPGIPFLLVGVAGALGRFARAEGMATLFCGLTGVGLLGVAISAASFPAFPLVYQNPIYSFALPMLIEGFYTPSLLLPDALQPGAVSIYLGLVLCVAVYVGATAAPSGAPKWRVACAGGLLTATLMGLSALAPEPANTKLKRERTMAEVLKRMGHDVEYERRMMRLREGRLRPPRDSPPRAARGVHLPDRRDGR